MAALPEIEQRPTSITSNFRLEVPGFIPIDFREIPHPKIARISVFKTHTDLSVALAGHIYEIAQQNPDRSVLFPTGNTMVEPYSYLPHIVRVTGNNPFPAIKGRHLDEYWPCDPAIDDYSFARFIWQRVANPLGMNDIEYIDGRAPNARAEAERYDAIVQADQPVLTVMGTDPADGHLAFIRPGTPFGMKHVHYTELSDTVVRRDNGERGQGSPAGAITQGYNMLYADHLIVAASGANKGPIVSQALWGNITDQIPLSALRLPEYGPKTHIFIDEALAQIFL